MNERERLMREIQIHCFACRDVMLYLDSHPTCQNALAYFANHRQLLQDAVARYQQQYGPITAADAAGTESWAWINDPWPWELEA